MPSPSTRQLSWAALVVAIAALGIALSGGAIGLPGKKTVDKNDLKKNVVRSKNLRDGQIRLNDLSQEVKDALAFEPAAPDPGPPGPRAFALVLGPDDVDEARSKGISDSNISVNNGAFCIRGIGFTPRHAQVTARTATDPAHVLLNDNSACQGGTAVYFAADLMYPEQFYISLYD